MAEDLKRLINIRAAYKGQCTKNMKTAEMIMSSYEPSVEELEDLLEKILTRMEAIK